MKFVRVQVQNAVFYAESKENMLHLLQNAPWEGVEYTGDVIAFEDCKLLAPCAPNKVVAVGLNYLDHIKEMNDPMPDEPVIFLKPASSVVGPDDAIVWPKRSQRVDYEAELACVIGKTCKDVSVEEAKDYIFGYTCCNDVTARDLQPIDGQWTRAKGFDTFAPIGPCIETEFDPLNAPIASYLKGEVRQNGNTNMMMRNVYELVSFISSVMTLLPGDVITTGTPEGIGQMQEGDEIVIEIGGIGRLTNTLKR